MCNTCTFTSTHQRGGIWTTQCLFRQVNQSSVLYNEFKNGQYGDYYSEWKVDRVKEYVKKYEEFMDCLVFVVTLGGGMPPRATEVAKYMVTATATMFRTMFLYEDGGVYACPTNNKGNQIKQDNVVISRFFDYEASNILLYDMLFIRPFVVMMLHDSATNANHDDSATFLNYLFVHTPSQ